MLAVYTSVVFSPYFFFWLPISASSSNKTESDTNNIYTTVQSDSISKCFVTGQEYHKASVGEETPAVLLTEQPTF